MQVSNREIYNNELLRYQPHELVDKSYGKYITIITSDVLGAEYRGLLKGVDENINCILEDATELGTSKHHNKILINGRFIQLILPDQPPLE